MLISVEGNMICLCMITGSPQYAEEFEDAVSAFPVEFSRRLVCEDEFGGVDQTSGNGTALTLSAG